MPQPPMHQSRYTASNVAAGSHVLSSVSHLKQSKEREAEATPLTLSVRMLGGNHSGQVTSGNRASSSSNNNGNRSRSPAASTGQSHLISSFLTGLPASMFTPMIDMTSTQALVTLVREDPFHLITVSIRPHKLSFYSVLIIMIFDLLTHSPHSSTLCVSLFYCRRTAPLVNGNSVILHLHEVHAAHMMDDIWRQSLGRRSW